MKWSSLAVLLALVLSACGGGDNDSQTPAAVGGHLGPGTDSSGPPIALIFEVIRGNAPAPFSALRAEVCSVERTEGETYSVTCAGTKLLVNTQSLSVSPANASTRARWEAATRSRSSPSFTEPTQKVPSAEEIAEAQCRAEGGTLRFGRCEGGTADRLECATRGGRWAFGTCAGGRR
jgi:hypothetical protein